MSTLWSLVRGKVRAATGIGNTDFLSVTDFFAQKEGKLNIYRYFSWYYYRYFSKITLFGVKPAILNLKLQKNYVTT